MVRKLLVTGIMFFCHYTLIIAQCPVASSCIPGSAPSSALAFGMGIFSVSVSSGTTGFSHTTSGAADGYQDYSCLKMATVPEGVPTSITVTTNPNVNENIRVWVDLDNNGAFHATSELLFSSNNAKVHSGNITIPVAATVVKNQVLRMRIAADNFTSAAPTPCSTPAYSQTEDYGITVITNLNKPTVDFTVNKPVTCSPLVQFTNLVQNGATSYLWHFGDNTTSTLPNPSHSYAAPGPYTVKLVACNANGCDSLTKVNYVLYHTNAPVAASCSPATTSFCCGYGITKVTFHTMINSSLNGSSGYEDFTCTKSVTVEEGQPYQLSLETGTTNSQDTWAFIDYNNNGIFEPTEQVFSKLNAFNPSGTVTIGWNAVYNTPLRMRIISDAQGGTGNPCTNLVSGQAEDYTVIITPNTRKPVPQFTTNFTSTCDTVIQFTEASQYKPTSFIWDFGDGSPTVTTRNPTHSYSATGTYTVKLIACNNIGCDSITKVNSITITNPCQSYCNFQSNNNNVSITNVKFNTINNTSGKELTNYGNYTNLATPVIQGNFYQLEVSTLTHIYVYIDFNQDGDFFDFNESFKNTVNNPSNVLTINIGIPANARPGITRLRIIAPASSQPLSACSPWGNSNYEVEDYSLLILPNNLSPLSYFYTPRTNSCSYTIAFADTSANGPTTWLWNFGDPASGINNNSNLPNPSHTFSGPGTYNVRLTTYKGALFNSILKSSYVTISGNTGPRTTTCIGTSLFKSNNTAYFQGFSLANISMVQVIPTNSKGYADFSCTHNAILPAIGTSTLSIIASGSWVKGWIDYNDDGTFDEVTESIIFNYIRPNYQSLITPPSNTVLNKPLRIRLVTELGVHRAPLPCYEIESGSILDFAVTFSTISGIESNHLSHELKVFPNPSNGSFSLELPANYQGKYELEVTNMVGQKVAVQPVIVNDGEKTLINLHQLPKGVYLLKLSNEKVSAVKRVILE